MTKRALSGIKPTGDLHLGNYFGAFKGFLELQSEENMTNYYFIADYHALNECPDPAVLRQRTLNIFKAYIALGLDPHRSTVFVQSDVPQHTELCWLLMGLTPLGLLERAHAYKDSLAKGRPVNMGLFNYPVLMAVDILMYDATLVPVGADQKQHVEITRDIAEKFNHIYGPVFTIPEPRIQEETAVVPGIDGEKMSKSRDNYIPIFSTEQEIKSRIMSIKTDSTPLEEPKNPETCTVFNIYKLFVSEAEAEAMAQRYQAGGYGYGHAKKELLQCALNFFAPAREKMKELDDAPDEVEKLMHLGAERARDYASQKVKQARKAVGLGARYA